MKKKMKPKKASMTVTVATGPAFTSEKISIKDNTAETIGISFIKVNAVFLFISIPFSFYLARSLRVRYISVSVAA